MEEPGGSGDGPVSRSRTRSAGPTAGPRKSTTAAFHNDGGKDEPKYILGAGGSADLESGLRVAILVCPWVPMLHGLDPLSPEASDMVDLDCIAECVAITNRTSIEIKSQASISDQKRNKYISVGRMAEENVELTQNTSTLYGLA